MQIAVHPRHPAPLPPLLESPPPEPPVPALPYERDNNDGTASLVAADGTVLETWTIQDYLLEIRDQLDGTALEIYASGYTKRKAITDEVADDNGDGTLTVIQLDGETRVEPIHKPSPTMAPARNVTPNLTAVPVAPPIAPGAPTGVFGWPVRGIITTYFQWWHPAIDIAAPAGVPVSAADGGICIYAGWENSGYGYRVCLQHGAAISTYNHLSHIAVRVGQLVAKGQLVGRIGSTGRSTGPHLHFEIARAGAFLNPLSVLR